MKNKTAPIKLQFTEVSNVRGTSFWGIEPAHVISVAPFDREKLGGVYENAQTTLKIQGAQIVYHLHVDESLDDTVKNLKTHGWTGRVLALAA